ncbi:Uncharacterised protein [Mycobacterium tuberculosis]|nr:Uncharacterised protein [Mycobacterium tuberculosis]
MPPQRGRGRAHPVAGQVHQPPLRHLRRQLHRPQPHPQDLLGTLERLLQIPARRHRRALSPPLQIRRPRALGHLQQQLQYRPLPRRQHRVQALVQPLDRLITHPRHQPRQRRHARQQHLAGPQPHHPVGEDALRAVPGIPRPRVHPRRELVLGVGEVPQPVGPPDLLLVIERRLPPLGVPLDHRRIGDPELIRQVVQHLGRHVQRIGQEPAHEPRRGHLQREPQPARLAPPLGDQLTVGVVQEEQLLQLRPRRRPGVPAVGGRFLITQEHNWHGPRK